MGSCYIYKYITKKWLSLGLCLLTSSDVHAILPTEKKVGEYYMGFDNIPVEHRTPVYENTYVWKSKCLKE